MVVMVVVVLCACCISPSRGHSSSLGSNSSNSLWAVGVHRQASTSVNQHIVVNVDTLSVQAEQQEDHNSSTSGCDGGGTAGAKISL